MEHQAFAAIVPANSLTRYYNPNARFQIRMRSDAFNGVHFETRDDAVALVASLRVCKCGEVARDGAPHFSRTGHTATGTVGIYH